MVNFLDSNLGAFLGAFISEGTMSNQLGIKITSKDLNFLNTSTNYIKAVLGNAAASDLPPTKEHKEEDRGYHKYYSNNVSKLLIGFYGIKPGRKVLSNQGLPENIMKIIKGENTNEVKEWLKKYMQMRYTGDGHVRNTLIGVITRRIVLTRNISVNLNENVISTIKKEYFSKKPVNEYSNFIIDILKIRMKNKENYPKEFFDLQHCLEKLFSIESKLYCAGLRSIYYDKKLDKIIVTAIYRLVISKRKDILNFHYHIGFADFDIKNKQKLIKVLNSYKDKSIQTAG